MTFLKRSMRRDIKSEVSMVELEINIRGLPSSRGV
jgi:hypothetical protein